MIPNVVALGMTVRARVGSQKLGDTCDGAWLTLRITILPQVCDVTKFGRSRLNRFGVGRGSQNIGTMIPAPLRWWHGDPPRNLLLPYLSYQANFGHSGSNRTSVIMEICNKFPHFMVTQGHCYRHGSIGIL